jgi:cytochrome c
VAAVGLGHTHPFGDPYAGAGAGPAKGASTLLRDAGLPEASREVLVTKCADCHSDATAWPAYARVAPGSWLIERDVIEGRKHMNLSHWSELTPEAQQTLESKIAHEAKSGEMPPLQYLAIHWNARLSNVDVQSLMALSHSSGGSEASLGGEGDPAHGKLVFEKRCTGCHAMDANRDAPKLTGVYGRKVGSAPGFDYSQAMKSSSVVWNDALLDKWLIDTETVVKDNNMDFSLPKADERRDIIAYLKKSSGQ